MASDEFPNDPVKYRQADVKNEQHRKAHKTRQR